MKTYGGDYLDKDEVHSLGFRSIGCHVLIHSTCVLIGIENISIENNVRIDSFCTLVAGEGHIKIGNHVHIGAYTFLSGGEGIELDDFSGVSHGVRLLTRNDDYSGQSLTGPTIPVEYTTVKRGSIKVGRHCIIGSGCVVLPDLFIGEGSVVGALSLVRESLAPWGVYAGVPVKRLKDRSRNLLEKEKRLLELEKRTFPEPTCP